MAKRKSPKGADVIDLFPTDPWEIVDALPGEGSITAALIGPCPVVGGDDIWIARDRSFKSDDGNVVYYADELPILAIKSPQELMEIHKVKKVFPGSIVRK